MERPLSYPRLQARYAQHFHSTCLPGIDRPENRPNSPAAGKRDLWRVEGKGMDSSIGPGHPPGDLQQEPWIDDSLSRRANLGQGQGILQHGQHDRPTSQEIDLSSFLKAVKEPRQPKDMRAESERRSISSQGLYVGATIRRGAALSGCLTKSAATSRVPWMD